jgi:hypothetical protein
VTKILFTPDECNRTYSVGLQIVAPNGNIVQPDPTPIQQRVDPRPPLPNGKIAIGAMIFGIPVHEAGVYGFQVVLDNVVVKTVPVYVRLAATEPPGAASAAESKSSEAKHA